MNPLSKNNGAAAKVMHHSFEPITIPNKGRYTFRQDMIVDAKSCEFHKTNIDMSQARRTS